LREQKWNDVSVSEAKIGGKQSRQSNSKHNFMQYDFFKKVYAVYNGVWSGAKPQKLQGILDNFFLTICKVTLNCKLQSNLGEQDVY